MAGDGYPENSGPPDAQAQWREENLRDPHGVTDKAVRVRRMFAAIASSYDLNNRLHSMWRDQAWRREAVRLCGVKPDNVVLDAACGTGDLSLAFARAHPRRVIGIDFTHEMLRIAKRKSDVATGATDVPVKEAVHTPEATPIPPRSTTILSVPTPLIQFACGDALRLPVPASRFDVVSIAFGIRNVADPAAAIAEFYRVLRPGGRLCILEFSIPTNPLLRAAYMFYFRHVMPRTATLISGDQTGAYKYLPQSVNTFLSREQMVRMVDAAGFTAVEQHPLTFGIAVVYIGHKPG